MPIPTPNEGETEEQFVPRCHSALSKIHPDWDRAKRHSVCLSQFKAGKKNSKFTRQLTIQNVSPGDGWKRLNDFLLIEEAELLGPGTWTGADGIPTTYSPEVIKAANQSILGKPIKISHADKSSTVVGFWDAVKEGERTVAQGMVWHPDGIKYFEEHPNAPLSVEASAPCSFDPVTGTDTALSMVYTGGAAVDIPAYPSGGVRQQRKIALSGRIIEGESNIKIKKEKEKTMEQWKPVELTEEQKKALEQPFFAEKKLGTKRSEVIAHLKKSLEAGKVPEEQATFILKTLEANIGGDFAVELPEVTPPAGTGEPPAGTPTGGALGKEEGTEETPNDDNKVTELEERIESLKGELDTAKKAIDDRLSSDIQVLGKTIKSYDPSFEATKFLEGITDKNMQKKLLERHAETVKRINPQPIELKLSAEEAKTKLNKVSNELFGTDMKGFFEAMGLTVSEK